jgi:hypothetical protein
MVPCVAYGGEQQYQFVFLKSNLKICYTPEVKYVELDIAALK